MFSGVTVAICGMRNFTLQNTGCGFVRIEPERFVWKKLPVWKKPLPVWKKNYLDVDGIDLLLHDLLQYRHGMLQGFLDGQVFVIHLLETLLGAL